MEETEEKDEEKASCFSGPQDDGDIEMKENEEEKEYMKSDREQNDNNDDDDDDDKDANTKEEEENSPYLRVSDPAVLSCHHDGYLRFWALEVSASCIQIQL